VLWDKTAEIDRFCRGFFGFWGKRLRGGWRCL